jgi:hypothetical protein
MIDWRTDQFSLGVVMSIAVFNYHPYQSNGSPIISSDTIENLCNRKKSDLFKEKCKESNLDSLNKMTMPWPVERFRKPDNLLSSWNNQREK